MTVTYTLYSWAQRLVLVVGIVAGLAVFSGFVGTTYPSVPLPDPPWVGALGLVGAGLLGYVVFGHLRIRTWLGVGRSAGLTPDGGTGPLARMRATMGGVMIDPLPDLTGEIHGREVRVHTYQTSSEGSNSSNNTYTIVEAPLAHRIEAPLMIASQDGTGDVETGQPIPGDLEMEPVGDGFVALGENAQQRAEEILSGRVRNTLLATDGSVVVVGNPADIVMNHLTDQADGALEMVAGAIQSRLEAHPGFDAETVSCSNDGLLVDADRLARQAEAAAAVADAVEHAGLK